MKNKENDRLGTIIRILFIAFLFLIQIAFMILLTYFLKNHAVIVYTFIEVLSVIVLMHLMAEERNSAYKMFWMTIVLLLPIVGHIMYDFWGKKHSNLRKHSLIQKQIDRVNYKQITNDEILNNMDNIDAQRLSSYLTNYHYPPYKNNITKLFFSGDEAYEKIKDDIRNAKKFIFISVYTISKGKVLNEIYELLKEKAREGVEVKLIYDDIGSILKIPKGLKEHLEEIGMEVTVFNEIHKNAFKQYYNYRSHQKIIVIDGNISYTGGFDLKDSFINLQENDTYYKDCAVRTEGESTWSFTLIFIGMWNAASDNKIKDFEKYKNTYEMKCGIICQPFADGPANYVHIAEDMYKYLISTARRTLYLTTPYLNPDDEMVDCLCLAAKSGVDIRIITPKIYDKKVSKYLSEYNFGRLLKNGVRIYEYNKGLIRSKIILNEFASIVGTINMNFRSFYLHYECGNFVPDTEFTNELKYEILELLIDCDEITFDEWIHRSKKTKVIQYVLNIFKSQL
ncbi:cardiolipin synthase [uncultured Anaerofustis sp.]|uniref:cardiolipin synthase n=1 Tax=uncultured Anaerofustis sp. TaxID=904996 RepID=UPI0025F27050|nr:cardiolipin synthase [uncultured Anaerofustis sp.]